MKHEYRNMPFDYLLIKIIPVQENEFKGTLLG